MSPASRPHHTQFILEHSYELTEGRRRLAQLLDVPDTLRLCDLIDVLKWRIAGIYADVQTIKEKIS